MDQGIEDAVVMDDKTFKSLTSKTRTDILKLLKKRNHTLSEIAEELKISKTTVKEHIDILIEGRLIEQVPSTNKWKYYTLTKDGRKLVGEEGPKRVVITLVALVIGFFISVYGFTGFMESVGGTDAVMLTAETTMPQATMAGGEERTFDAEWAEEPMAIAAEEEIMEDSMNAVEPYEIEEQYLSEPEEEIPLLEENETEPNLTPEEAFEIANSSSCAEEGEVDTAFNYDWQTWIFGINTNISECIAVCLVDDINRSAKVGWRCLGAEVPDEEPIDVAVEKIPEEKTHPAEEIEFSEEEQVEEPTTIIIEEYETPLIIPNYVALMLGIVGIAIMGMAVLLFLKGKKNKRSVL